MIIFSFFDYIMHYIIVYIRVCCQSFIYFVIYFGRTYIIIYIGYDIFDLYIFSYEFGIMTSGEGSVY